MNPEQRISAHQSSSFDAIRMRVAAFLGALAFPHAPIPIVLGVSGGPDSLCMADVIISLQTEALITPIIAHLNHGLRGQFAVDDLEFVRRFAVTHQLPFHSDFCDVRLLASQKHLSIETAARVARYSFLESVASSVGSRYIAIAHNSDDQVETILQRLIRGTGMTGLQGMQSISPLRGSGNAQGESLFLLRPLLAIPRTMIEAYCKERALDPRHDATNEDRHHTRNRIRNDVLPMLEQLNPAIRLVILRLAETARSDNEIVQSATHQALDRVRLQNDPDGGIDRQAWSALPISLQRATLRVFLQLFNGELTNVKYAGIEEARDVLNSTAIHAQIAILSGVRISVAPRKFWLVRVQNDLL